jgi:hypothetical protein
MNVVFSEAEATKHDGISATFRLRVCEISTSRFCSKAPIFQHRDLEAAELAGRLFYGNGLGQIPWLIHVASATHGDVVSQQLERNNLKNRR